MQKSWVWQLDSQDAREVSTKDAGVSKDFYGGVGSPLEDALASVEGRWAATLTRIDALDDPGIHSEPLREFVWTLALRGKALRDQFSGFARRMIEEAAKPEHAALFRSSLQQHALRDFDQILESALNQLPKPQADAVRNAMSATPELRSLLIQQILKMMEASDYSRMISSAASSKSVRAAFESATAAGQVRGLGSIVVDGHVSVPDVFRPARWAVLHFPDEEIVLGDSCVVAVSQDNESGTWLSKSSTWRQIYVPISRHSVLLADRQGDALPWGASDINRASCEVSTNQVFSGAANEGIRSLAQSIGLRDAPMSDDALRELVSASMKGSASEPD